MQPVLSKISYLKKFFYFLQTFIFFPKFYDHMDSRAFATFGAILPTVRENTFLWLLEKLAYMHCLCLLACRFSSAHSTHVFVHTPDPAPLTPLLPKSLETPFWQIQWATFCPHVVVVIIVTLDHLFLNPFFFLASGPPCSSGLVSTSLVITFLEKLSD